MRIDFETAKENLTKLIVWANENNYDKKRNEATTRLQLIDRIIFECLGWEREDCVTEDNYKNTYVDYILGGTNKRCVIEAKKEGVAFELPAGFNKRICKLNTLIDLDAGIAAAIKQAIGYCQNRGVPIGVVCNGNQIIAFVGSRQDGIPPLEGHAVVFSSFQEMQSDFKTLWDSISRAAALNYSIFKILKIQNVLPPEKLSQRLGGDFPGYKMRNAIQNELQILCGLLIEDITRDPQMEEDFQKECYCPSGALSQYALIGKKILEARYSSLFLKEIQTPAVPISTKHGISKEFSEDIFSANLGRRPIILLGEVGSGKSMFIRHFIALEAKDVLKRALVLYIDFGKEPALPTELTSYIIKACKIKLLNEHKIDIEERGFVKGVYDLELKRFAKGIYAHLKEKNPEKFEEEELKFLENKLKDEALHLKASLEHISKGQQRQIVVFLDNVDQRPLDFQDQVFLIGHGLAEGWPGTVFISLRPDTFYYSKRKGSLSGYQPRVFTISPPRVDLVITKRLRFALNQLGNTGKLGSFPEGLSVHSDTLTQYIGVVLDSFGTNEALIEFIDNLSGGNIRQAIDFLTAFTGSGHVDTQKIMDAVKKTGRYIIPLHEFMRAVIFGDHEYYNSNTSPIINLFDISSTDGREHFLLPIIILHIERLGALGGKEGFVNVSKIFELGQSLGFQPSQIQFSLEKALRKHLLESNPKFVEPSDITSYRITTVGSYTAKRMVSTFQYIDAVIVDTPIVDDQMREKITEVKSIFQRLERSEVFCDYLDSEWNLLGTHEIPFNWSESSAIVRSTIQDIRQVLIDKGIQE